MGLFHSPDKNVVSCCLFVRMKCRLPEGGCCCLPLISHRLRPRFALVATESMRRTELSRTAIDRHLYRIMRTGACCSSRTSWPVGYGMLSGRRPRSSLARSFRDLRPSLWPFARKHDKVRPLMIACMCPRGFECPGVPYLAAISAFSQQLAYTCMPGHEPLPLFWGFSHAGSEVRGERNECCFEPRPRARGYASL